MWPPLRAVLALLLAVTLLALPAHASAQQQMGGLEVGGLYSVSLGEGYFRIAKVVALGREAVHIRLYADRFATRPGDIDPGGLRLGGAGSPEGWGIGHLPLSWELFARWQPNFIRSSPVEAEELEGYEEWHSARGGIWAVSGDFVLRCMLRDATGASCSRQQR